MNAVAAALRAVRTGRFERTLSVPQCPSARRTIGSAEGRHLRQKR